MWAIASAMSCASSRFISAKRLAKPSREVAADPDDITKTCASERLGGDLDSLLGSARANFGLGDNATACFAAMKAVEVEVRSVAGLPNEMGRGGAHAQGILPEGRTSDRRRRRGRGATGDCGPVSPAR